MPPTPAMMPSTIRDSSHPLTPIPCRMAAAPPDTASSPVSNTPFRMSPTVNVRKNTKHIISRNTGIPHTGWVRSRSILSVEAAFLLLLKRVSFITFSI